MNGSINNSQPLEGLENFKPDEIEENYVDDKEFEDENEQRHLSELDSSTTPIITDSNLGQVQTLVLPENDHSANFKHQIRVSRQQALVLSPTSVTHSTLSVPSPTTQEQRALSPLGKNNNGISLVTEPNQKNYSDSPRVKASSVDGYNWRKYGQKQVKSPEGSRSYYKCTYSECFAKKIECCDTSSSVLDIIYKSGHNHDPPPKVDCTSETKLVLSVAPVVVENNTTNQLVRTLSYTEPATLSGQIIQEIIQVPETKQRNSCGSETNVQMDVMEEQADEPEPKRRVKNSSPTYPGPTFKPGKKPKFVVHAAGDVGISGDGYRWRKYGQKMVKGTPHPRNYYRCTSSGCPVRKHIEMATNNTSAVVITYKGVHDHDMPVPKKRHGPPGTSLLSAAAPASMNNLQIKKPEVLPNEISATQWSVDQEGELTGETLELGQEKAMGSARTLLSIGIEIKPC